jgi:hypothetical protein
VTAPLVIVPAGVEEFDYPVTLPPWMEIGRTSRTVVMATALIREPDGSEHEVSFSSTRNEVQAVSVIEPGLLGLEARVTSLAVAPEKTLDVTIKLSRGKGVDGAVRVELVALGSVRGLSAEPLVLGFGQNEGVVRIHCGASVECPRIAQILLRARSVDLVDPVTAETMLTIVNDNSTGRDD